MKKILWGSLLAFLLGFGFISLKKEALGQWGVWDDITSAVERARTEAYDTSIMVSHSPIYPRTGEGVTFTAQAKSDIGIKKIRFWVKIYDVSVGSGGDPAYSGPPDSFDSDDSGSSCVYSEPYPTTATCTYSLTSAQLPANSYVWYRSTMRLSNDALRRDRKIRFAAKLSSAVRAAYNYAVPVYRRGKKSDKMNLLFIADNDYGSAGPYITDMTNFVFSGLFQDKHLKKYRRFFDIYMNDYSRNVDFDNPDGGGCGDSTVYDVEPSNWDDLSGFDSRVYIHATSFQDCSRIRLANDGLSSADAPNVTTHELLHSLAGQGDEYPGSSGNVAGPHPNVFDSEDDCEDHAADHATEYAASPGCRDLAASGTATGIYHWCPSSDVMTDSGSGALSTEEHAQVAELIDDEDLSAFSQPTFLKDEKEEAKRDAEESIKDDIEELRREKISRTLLIRLRFEGDRVSILKTKIIKGFAPHIFFPDLVSDYQVFLLDSQNRIQKMFWTQDPRDIAGEEGYGPESGRTAMNLDLRVRWLPNIARIKIQDRSGKVVLDAPLAAKPVKTFQSPGPIRGSGTLRPPRLPSPPPTRH